MWHHQEVGDRAKEIGRMNVVAETFIRKVIKPAIRKFVVCFPGVTTHCVYFHSPVAGFSLLVFEVS